MTNPSNKNSDSATAKNATKKAMVLGSGKKSRAPLLLAIAAVVVIAGGMVAHNVLSTTSQTGSTQSVSSAQAPNPTVTFAVSDFGDGRARHYQHTVGDLTIKYFIMQSSDGIIRAAFDACDVCWPAGKGYFQDGDAMVCRNCGRRFASIYINEVSGGCNPAPLTRRIEGDKVVIRVEDIIAGKNYFTFT